MTNQKRVNWMKGSTLLLAASLTLIGCTKEEPASQPTAASSAAPSTAAATPAQTLTFNWVNFPGVSTESNYASQYLEKKFNIKLNKVYTTAYADYKQKLQLQLSSGEIPDVMFVFDPGELNKYASQGLLAEVPKSLLEKYAPRTKANLDKQAPQGWYYSNVGGKNYGLTTFYFTGQFNAKQTWRTDLLKQAGITKVPETIDEFTAAFAALKKIGVYGMSTPGNSYYNQFHSIFGAYGVQPTQWMLKDGKVVNAAVQPEAKEALTKLVEWYKAGYIDPDFVTGQDLGPKFTQGKFAFNDNSNVSAVDESNPNSAISLLKKANPNGTIVFGPPPVGPQGKSGAWAWGTAGNIWAFGKQLEKSPEKLQKALQIIDEIQNNEEVWLALAWGEKGKHYDFNDPAAGVSAGLKRIGAFTDPSKLQAEGIPDLANGTTAWAAQPNIDIVAKYYNKNILDAFKTYNKPVNDIFGKSDSLPSSGKFWGDLIKLKTDTYAAIVRGDKPVSYFDDFVKQWNDKGGTQLEKEANELYASMKK
ncbi:extracellular solute-binding protein [Paenibacillus qinlingensis]|uniref:Aldouronate transport system substrate-binding protein n=1 Tax=Paenibacillus qinlingensis TaxID=1837343 RepID=A0ABU1NTQ9_9BACL|nr:extracellular solute-binding protein [Paenibacillus qinlingensis]MDR6550869.1 putative aldouronate transport system substrate-binding protein [Paenibacillus qinlingensis]